MKRLSFITWAGALTLCFISFSDVSAQFARKGEKLREAARTTQELPSESLIGVSPPAVVPLKIDEFAYATGQLTTTTPNWITNTGTGNFIPISSGSLSYPNYPSSGIANKIDIISTTGSAEDTYTNFTPQTTGIVYASFLVNVANVTGLAANSSATGDYFAGLIASNSTSNFVNRVTIRQGVTAGTYQLGLRATGNAGNVQTFSSTDLTTGTTVLVVIAYQFFDGSTTNDTTAMWINPDLTQFPQQAPALTQQSAADSPDIGRFFIRQGNAGTPNASIDGLRVGTHWNVVALPFISKAPNDFDGDGKSDYVVLRDSNGATAGGFIDWYVNLAGSGNYYQTQWGMYDENTEDLAPADYDEDGKTDIAVWRKGPTLGTFYILRSSNNTIDQDQLGLSTDDPAPGDYDGDGDADTAVVRNNGDGTSGWHYRPNTAVNYVTLTLGASGSEIQGDYDGDRITDPAVFSGSNATFTYRRSGNGQTVTTQFGTSTDMAAPGDYDGDAIWDLCVIRNVGGVYTWIYKRSSDGVEVTDTWGLAATDFPTPGDYNGDNKWDYAVWRNSAQGEFFVMTPVTRQIFQRQWGLAGDFPLALHMVGNSE